MYSKVISLLALAAVVQCGDLFEGANKTEERSIYSEHIQASPAIWKQSIDLTVNTTDHEVISKINITDLRPEKDGEIHITGGGVGHNNVSLTLKSPTILRGYDFLVEVFSIIDDSAQPSDLMPRKPSVPNTEMTTENTKVKSSESRSTEGATVTYPTHTPTDVTMTLATGMPNEADYSSQNHGKPITAPMANGRQNNGMPIEEPMANGRQNNGMPIEEPMANGRQNNGMPTEEPTANGKPTNGKDGKEVEVPMPTVKEVYPEVPESVMPLEVNLPKHHH